MNTTHEVQPSSVLALATAGGENSGVFIATATGLFHRREHAGESRRVFDASVPVTALARWGDTIIAGGLGGVRISRDAGTTWHAIGLGSPPPLVSALAMPDEGTILAGTLEDGVYRSRDAGQTWYPASAGLLDPAVQCLAAAPGLAMAATAHLSFLSTTSGASWTHCHELDAHAPVRSIAIGATTRSPHAIAVGTDAGAVLTSIDGGIAWSEPCPDFRWRDLLGVAWQTGSASPCPLVLTPDGVHELTGDRPSRQPMDMAAFTQDAMELVILTTAGEVRRITLSGR